MAVENTVGGVMITGDDIGRYRLVVLKSALKLEIKGIRMHRGRTAYSVIKKEFGFKGDRQRVLDQFETMIQRDSKR
jgi:uncharacterized protein (DUF2141 family)